MRKTLSVAGAAGLVLVLFAGSCDEKGLGDAPADQQSDESVKVWPMPDQFSNVAGLCIGGNGVYTTTREAAPEVVPDDPECKPGGALVNGEGS